MDFSAPRNTVSEVGETSKAGQKRGSSDEGSQQIKKANFSTSWPTKLLGAHIIDQTFTKPAFLWRGGAADDKDVRTQIYFPLVNTTRDVDLFGKDWFICGYAPFAPSWVTFHRKQEVKVSCHNATVFLPSFPSQVVGKVLIQKDSQVTIAVNFVSNGLKLFWHNSDRWGTWQERRIFQPRHSITGGEIIYKKMLLWLNGRDGTLHILRNWALGEKIVHESYYLGEDFIADQPGHEYSFSSVVAESDAQLYIVKFVQKWRETGELNVFLIDLKLNSFGEVMVPSASRVSTFDGLTMFVCKNKAGFLVQLKNERLHNRIFFCGFEDTHCVLLPVLNQQVTGPNEDQGGHILKYCDKMVIDTKGEGLVWDEDEYEDEDEDEDESVGDGGNWVCACDKLCHLYYGNEGFTNFLLGR